MARKDGLHLHWRVWDTVQKEVRILCDRKGTSADRLVRTLGWERGVL